MNMMTMPAQRAPKKNNRPPFNSNFKLRPAATSAGKRNPRTFDPVAYAAALEVLG